MGSPMVVCGACGTRVLPKADGTCPSCGSELPREPGTGPIAGTAEPAAVRTPGLEGRPESASGRPRRDPEGEGHLRAIALWLSIIGCIVMTIPLGVAFFKGPFGSPGTYLILGAVQLYAIGLVGIGGRLWRFLNPPRIAVPAVLILGILAQAGSIFVSWSIVASVAASLPFLLAAAAVLSRERNARMLKPEYREAMARTPDVKPAVFPSPFFLVPLVLFTVGFVIALFLMALRQ